MMLVIKRVKAKVKCGGREGGKPYYPSYYPSSSSEGIPDSGRTLKAIGAKSL
jgi:hypothetical protein